MSQSTGFLEESRELGGSIQVYKWVFGARKLLFKRERKVDNAKYTGKVKDGEREEHRMRTEATEMLRLSQSTEAFAHCSTPVFLHKTCNP